MTNNIEFIFDRYFPYKNSFINSNKQYNVILGIGGNIGDSRKLFRKLFLYLQNSIYYDIISTSPILKNPPFGFTEQNMFHNATLWIKTDVYPTVLLKNLLQIEKRFGRIRTFKNAPRKIDIDMIFKIIV
jgi:2-amino-4-hydroxy-6-hydroxymethyldihydropteridine diphosphokinase